MLIPTDLVVVPDAAEIAAAELPTRPRPPQAPVLAPVSGKHGAHARQRTPRPGVNLPRRVRQTNMAPQLREEPAKPDLFSSFQAGWRRAEDEDR